ncbi:hypothetical protein Patl1_32185 [Pistacia atlantica]|uniref:Uncharacterized protein n=1 Tax=Pistacia atlantica TaxID=434234 RepID=A0ACC1AN51_9ROSI|nr:hypothetical protein Patl1_32185 [Pistacia atlantica]
MVIISWNPIVRRSPIDSERQQVELLERRLQLEFSKGETTDGVVIGETTSGVGFIGSFFVGLQANERDKMTGATKVFSGIVTSLGGAPLIGATLFGREKTTICASKKETTVGVGGGVGYYRWSFQRDTRGPQKCKLQENTKRGIVERETIGGVVEGETINGVVKGEIAGGVARRETTSGVVKGRLQVKLPEGRL